MEIKMYFQCNAFMALGVLTSGWVTDRFKGCGSWKKNKNMGTGEKAINI